MVDYFSDPGLCRIPRCTVLHSSEVMVSSVFVLSHTLCNVIFILLFALMLASFVFNIACLYYVPNLSHSALSIEICIIIPFVYVAYVLKEKMHCNVFELF